MYLTRPKGAKLYDQKALHSIIVVQAVDGDQLRGRQWLMNERRSIKSKVGRCRPSVITRYQGKPIRDKQDWRSTTNNHIIKDNNDLCYNNWNMDSSMYDGSQEDELRRPTNVLQFLKLKRESRVIPQKARSRKEFFVNVAAPSPYITNVNYSRPVTIETIVQRAGER